MWHFWLIAAGACFVLEIITVGFLMFWFGIGALIAMLVSLIVDNIIIQITVFIISSTLLLLFTKPLLNKFLVNKTVTTNAFSIIGKRAIVTKEINSLNGTGQIKVGNEIWSAKCEAEDIIIPEGEEVEIIGIDGVKATVKIIRIKSELISKS